MKKTNIFILLFAVLMLTACVSTGSSVSLKASFKEKEVSFKSEDGHLKIYNNTNQDVVVFVGRVGKNLVLGGIKSYQGRTFNLSKLSNIPESGALLIRIVPYVVYKTRLITMEGDVVYTGLVVYDLKDKKKVDLEIPEVIDFEQKHYVYIKNESQSFILELREGSSTGKIIATLPPMDLTCVFWLPSIERQTYALFPSFLYVNPNTQDVVNINSSIKDAVRIDGQIIAEGHPMITFSSPSNKEFVEYPFIKLWNEW